MSGRFFLLCLALAILAPGLPVRADDTPIIMTYELKKQRQAARAVNKSPKALWIRQILARLESKAPVLSKPLREAVVVRLSFVVARDGHVISRVVSAPSGNEAADRAALAMVDRAQPFPPMPPVMSDTDLSFNLPVRFH